MFFLALFGGMTAGLVICVAVCVLCHRLTPPGRESAYHRNVFLSFLSLLALFVGTWVVLTTI